MRVAEPIGPQRRFCHDVAYRQGTSSYGPRRSLPDPTIWARRLTPVEDRLEIEVRDAGQAVQTWSLAGIARVRLAMNDSHVAERLSRIRYSPQGGDAR